MIANLGRSRPTNPDQCVRIRIALREYRNRTGLRKRQDVPLRKILAALTFLACWGAPAGLADTRVPVDGNTLHGWCKPVPGGLPNQPVEAYCAGFINGVVEIHGEETTLYGHRACVPLTVTIHEMRRIVMAWLEDHPEKRHLVAHGLVGEALSRAFPCE